MLKKAELFICYKVTVQLCLFKPWNILNSQVYKMYNEIVPYIIGSIDAVCSKENL